jgi:hypothetical protein
MFSISVDLLLSILSKHQGHNISIIKLLSLDQAVFYTYICNNIVSLLYYYLMSFLSEPLSPLWSQQQLSTLLRAAAVVTLPLQAVAGVLAVVLLLFEPAVEVWYAGWQAYHKPAVLASSCVRRGGVLYKVYT